MLMPNPFYQIYEGAALLAGAEPVFFCLALRKTGLFRLLRQFRQNVATLPIALHLQPRQPDRRGDDVGNDATGAATGGAIRFHCCLRRVLF